MWITTCPKKCSSNGSLHCQDVLSAVIQAILNLKSKTGSTVDEIVAYLPTLCANIDTSLVAAAVQQGAKQGVLFRVINPITATPSYMIMAYGNTLNPVLNQQYARYPCQADSFFQA